MTENNTTLFYKSCLIAKRYNKHISSQIRQIYVLTTVMTQIKQGSGK